MEQSLADYQLIREAGRGGMSTVYEARDVRNGRIVALKVLAVHPSLSPAEENVLVTRLAREARAITRLSHPHIVTVYEIGEQEGRHYLAMEYLAGHTLRERLDAGPFTPIEAAHVLDQIAGALDAVHEAGFVHRDLKPSNVMLLPGGQIKLMDFGVVRRHDDTTITQAGSIIGSPAYISPEQVRGEAGTNSSDIWALGILLYEMLAGRPAFGGQGIASVLYKVTYAPVPVIPGAPIAVQKVLRRTLDKNPARRYASACDMANAFRASLTERPPRPPSPPYLLFWQGATLLTLGMLGIKMASHLPKLANASVTHPPAAMTPVPEATALTILPQVIAPPSSRQPEERMLRPARATRHQRHPRRVVRKPQTVAVTPPTIDARRTASASGKESKTLRNHARSARASRKTRLAQAWPNENIMARPIRLARHVKPRLLVFRRAEPFRPPSPDAHPVTAPPKDRVSPKTEKKDDKQSLENLERFIYNN